MIIDFDIKLLAEKHITANEFTICQLILKDRQDILSVYLNSNNENVDQLKKLIEKKYIRDLNNDNEFNVNKLYVSELFRDKFIVIDFFDELLNKYPVKVLRSDGSTDYLRTDLMRCRKAYVKLTANKKTVHENILKCLDIELKKRKSEGSMAYMKRLPKWMASEEWKIYEGELGNIIPEENKEVGYGTDLI